MMEQDLIILENIKVTLENQPDASQRTLALESHVSLGMMNSVIRRCVKRGWLEINNLTMKKVRYCLTMEGLKELSKRSSDYVINTFKIMNQYSSYILKKIKDAKDNREIDGVVLLGKSKVNFVIEWACIKNQIDFYSCDEINADIGKKLIFIGEMHKYAITSVPKNTEVISMVEYNYFN